VKKNAQFAKIGKIFLGVRGVSDLRIDKVETKSDLGKFIRFPWTVYKGDPNWVPPLFIEIKEKLDRARNPFFEHSEMELFLARRAGDITGRVAAIIDRNHNAFHDEKVVFFGLYESLDDQETAQALLDTVARWGGERGMDTLRGPMNLSMNDECAFLIEGFDSPPVIMMAYNPRYYLELMEKCGLTKAKDLYAFFMTRDHQVAEKIKVIVDRVRQETKIALRVLEKRTLDQDVEKIVHVYNNAWEKNWGFVPWTKNEMKKTVDKLKQFADLRLVLLAEDDGRPVVFAFGLPN
jgi:hypothetical protein